MKLIGLIMFLLLVIELKFKPRIDNIQHESHTDIILWYTIKSKFGGVRIREYLHLFKI